MENSSDKTPADAKNEQAPETAKNEAQTTNSYKENNATEQKTENSTNQSTDKPQSGSIKPKESAEGQKEETITFNPFNSESNTSATFSFNPFSDGAPDKPAPKPVEPPQPKKQEKLQVSIPQSLIVVQENIAPLHLTIEPADESTTYQDLLELAESEAFAEGAFDFTELASIEDPMDNAEAAFKFLNQ